MNGWIKGRRQDKNEHGLGVGYFFHSLFPQQNVVLISTLGIFQKSLLLLYVMLWRRSDQRTQSEESTTNAGTRALIPISWCWFFISASWRLWVVIVPLMSPMFFVCCIFISSDCLLTSWKRPKDEESKNAEEQEKKRNKLLSSSSTCNVLFSRSGVCESRSTFCCRHLTIFSCCSLLLVWFSVIFLCIESDKEKMKIVSTNGKERLGVTLTSAFRSFLELRLESNNWWLSSLFVDEVLASLVLRCKRDELMLEILRKKEGKRLTCLKLLTYVHELFLFLSELFFKLLQGIESFGKTILSCRYSFYPFRALLNQIFSLFQEWRNGFMKRMYRDFLLKVLSKLSKFLLWKNKPSTNTNQEKARREIQLLQCRPESFPPEQPDYRLLSASYRSPSPSLQD